jgi:Tfp pilus assembly protein PilF
VSFRFGRSLLAVAGCALLGAGAYLWWVRRHQPAESGVLRVAVLPAENQSGDDSLEWTGTLLSYSLVRQMEGAPRLMVFAAASRAEAEAAGATGQVECRVIRNAGQAEVRFFLYGAAPGKILAHGAARAAGGDPPALLAQSGAALAAVLGLPGAARPSAFHNAEAAREFAAALRQPAESAGHFEAAALADDACGWCWLAWAESAARRGDSSSALAVVERSRKAHDRIDPISRARLELLESEIKPNQTQRLSALERLAAALPADAGVQSQLAETLVAVRRFAPAEAAYRRAIQIHPARAELWNSLAYNLAYAGKFTEARQALAKYAALDSASANPLDSAGEIALMAGDFSQAAKLLAESYDKDKTFNDGAALEKAALARYLSGDRDAAGPLLERYLTDRGQRGDPLAGLSRARWEYLVGQTAQSRARLSGIASDPGNPPASIAAAMLALRQAAEGNREAAVRSAAAARSLARNPGQRFIAAFAAAALDPSAASALTDPAWRADARAFGLTLRGEWAAAAQAWQEALPLARGGADSPQRELLALCLVFAGRASEAAGIVAPTWPLLTRDQALLYDFLIYPNLLYVRAEVARAAGRGAEAQRLYDIFLQYAGDRLDRFGAAARARSAARL